MTTAAEPNPHSRTPSLDTPAVKVTAIVILAAVLLVPIFLVDQINRDRASYQEEARAEYQKSWGPSQSVLGPILVVPYITVPGTDSRRYLYIAPRKLAVSTRLLPEVRRRGLFRAIVYKANVALTGEFNLAREGLPVGAEARLLWQEARLMLGATDLRDLQADASVVWNGRTLPLGEGPDSSSDISCGGRSLIWTPPLGEPSASPGAIPFSTALDLRGTGAFRVVPIGHQVDLKASAAWSDPSFSGVALPSHYEIDNTGFSAHWSVTNNPAIGRAAWSSAGMPSCDNGTGAAQNGGRQVNVELIEAMPIYHMSERASKYAVLFLALTFLTYFLFETIARVHIHLIQYGLLGLSIALFGLLLISFSEPLGFTPAYAVSSLLILGQASLFTLSVTRVRRLAATFAGILAGLFCFLYVVLSLELYALLVGSVALFAALSVVMAVCRRIDWSLRRNPPEMPRGSREAGRGILS